MERMGLSLVVGPAHAGKVALLLERYLDVLDRDPWLIVPNRATSSASSATCSAARRRCSPGGSGRSTTCSSTSPRGEADRRPVASEPQRALAVRRAVAACRPRRARRARRDRRVRRRPARDDRASSSRRCSTPSGSTATSAVLARAYRARARRRSGSADRDGLRARAVERLASELDAWHGRARLRVRLRGPDRRGVGAARDALRPDGRHRLDPVRAGAGRVRIAGADGRRPRGAGCRPHRRAPPTGGPGCSRGAPAPRARALRRRSATRAAARRLAPVPRRGRDAGDARAPGEEVAALLRAGAAAERIAIVCDSLERWRAPLEAVFGQLGIPYVIEHGARLGDVDARPGAARPCSASRGSGEGAATCSRSCARRSRVSTRRSVDFVEGRLRGRAVTDPARVEEESERFRGAALPALAELREAADPVSAARALLRTMVRNAWGLDVAADTRRREARRRASRAPSALSTTLRRPRRRRRRAALEPRTSSPRSSEHESRPPAVGQGARRRARLRASAHAALRRRLRARARGGQRCRGAARPRRSSTTTRVGELGGRLERPDPVARDRYLFYTACTRALPSGSCSSARPRPTTASRASRARSGTRSARCSTRTTSAARRGGGRSRR